MPPTLARDSHVRPALTWLALCGSAVAAGMLAAQTPQSKEVFVGVANAAQTDPLPSWNDTAAKRSILTFVQEVTTQNGPNYVPPAARIAVFDNDGTLWSEQPLYIQLAFALDRVKTLAPEHPEWRTTQPFQAVLENDTKALGAAGVKGLLELVVATHAGMTTDEFERIGKEQGKGRSTASQSPRRSHLRRTLRQWCRSSPAYRRPARRRRRPSELAPAQSFR
jgi:haloacid dehalogenase-like hydrolase